MTTDNLVEMINKEIDGVNSHQDSEKLKEYLAQDSEARHLYEDFVRLSSLLKAPEEVEVPRNLRANILNSIDPRRYSPKAKRDPISVLVSMIPRRASLRYALVFSFGIGIGIALYAVVAGLSKDGSVENSKLYGTIRLDRASETFEPADNIEVNSDKVRASVTTKHGKDLVSVELSLQSQQEIETILKFDRRSLSLIEFRQPDNTANSIDITENTLRLLSTGERKYLLYFDEKAQAPSSIDVKIISSGSVIYERSLSTRKTS